MTNSSLNVEIVDDILRVAQQLGLTAISRSEYFQYGKFSMYQIYDGGVSWEDYCEAAGLKTRKVIPVDDEVYFANLVRAVEVLGRIPRTSERKKFGLNFSKRRYPNLSSFVDKAVQLGIIEPSLSKSPRIFSMDPISPNHSVAGANTLATTERIVPPIPAKTNRTRWERTGFEGFPYAPRDESGTIALFAVLCARGIIRWQILDLTYGKGIDAICWDEETSREIVVELKHTLSQTSWNHKIDDLEYVVCWENRWPNFPKQVLCLKDILKKTHE